MGVEIVDLGGRWNLRQAGAKKSLPAIVPGCVHTDLLAAGKIEDPFYRDNERRVQWITESAWTYTRAFDVPASLLGRDAVLLRCEGLDTLATIRLNGRKVARADNMFRTWEFDVKRLLRAGRNLLEVRFDSPTAYVRRRHANPSLPAGAGLREIKGRGWIRKEPCSFGWDWGPILASAGIWRAIRLVAFDTARLTDVQVLQDHTRRGRVGLTVSATVQTTRRARLAAAVRVRLGEKVIAEGRAAVRAGRASVALVVKDPRLWWPNTMGGQPLYDVTVDLLDEAGGRLDAQRRRVGLRTLRLVREKDRWGESFYFSVNGVPFFAKGANWIPADAFVTRLAREDYARLLRSAAEANMNILRVWGGGTYEGDDFYDLCDELGLCIWQDFMFACSTYPAFDAEFMANVKAEAEDNVRRIRHHACLALWCGNNELEQGMVGPKWNEWQMSWADYGKLFDKLLPAVVRQLDPQRDYWPCSPHSPHGDRRDFNNPTCGDAHLWDVWHGRKPFEWYRTCTHRFNSEFGFQSFPEPATVRGYTAPSDRNVTTFVMEHHQRSGIGNTVIMQYMLDWFRLPKDFDSTLWLSQILQGMAIKYAVENWRRSMPRGMGTMYWQINDCWPVASWSSIDYHGRWKALHHMAKAFYSPLLISGLEDGEKGTVEVHVTSDLLTPREGRAAWVLTDVAGRRMAGGTKAVRIGPRRSTLAETLNLGRYLESHGPRDLMLWLELTVGGKAVASNFVTFARPKHLELQDPGITVAVRRGAEGTFRMAIKAARPALWAWLEVPGRDVKWSGNFLHVRPGAPVEVVASPEKPLTLAEFRKRLRVRSLIDTY